MNKKINFPIKESLSKSWAIFKMRPWFYATMAFVVFILSLYGDKNQKPNLLLMLVVVIATIIWKYVWMSVMLASEAGKSDVLNFKSISKHFPSFRQFWMLIGVGLLSALFILAGLIVLIIPGIYVAVMLSFSDMAYVDRQDGVKASIRYSWNIVKGNFWQVLWALVVIGFIIIAGVLALGVGLLVTYPLGMLMLVQLYRTLAKNHDANEAVIVQPTEITAPEPHHESEVPIQ